ncbi:MAG: DUF4335 domain-containing protein [Cyanobacteria bacterium J06638_6]
MEEHYWAMAAIASVTTYEYAAGTCTLRLVGQLSPLSQVTGRPVLARSRFHLQVYQVDANPVASEAAPNPVVGFEASGREPQFSALTELVQGYVQRHLNAEALGGRGTISHGESTLQPVGLTRHRLTLAVAPVAQIAELSTLQLSDLADVLEQAEGNIQILPDQVNPRSVRPTRPRLLLWIGSVAAVGIAAILGNQFLATAPSPVVLSPQESQPTTESTPQAPSSNREVPIADPAPAADTLPGDESTATAPLATDAEPPAPAEPPSVTPQPARDPAQQRSPSAPPEPAAAPQQPTASQPSPPTVPAVPSQSDQASEQSGQSAPNQPSELSTAPDSPEAFRTEPPPPTRAEAEADIAASSVEPPGADWVGVLTNALEQQWQPPANLTAILRYRLSLEPDGTVTSLEPLDEVSAIYQNAPTLPQPNTGVSGAASGEAIAVDVQFLPSGDVLVEPTEAASP